MLNSFFKGFFRNLRDGGISSAAWYLSAPQIKSHIKKLVQDRTPLEQEVHILAGNERITMALWMVASWITVTGKHWRFVFHDDGKLGSKMGDKLQNLLPGCKVILDSDSRETMRNALSKYPLSWRCRNLHPLCRKLFDVPYYAEIDKFIAIDTDILFYRKPERLIRWMQGNETTTIFLEDIADATLPSVLTSAEKLGRKVVRKVNTGIVAMPKPAVTFDDIEYCLSKTTILNENPWFIEQSLYALLGSLRGKVELLGREYYMPVTGFVPKDAVIRHYMGKVRHLFYSEGIPKVAKLLANSEKSAEACAS